MILATLIAAAVGVATVGILSYFWDDIKNWLHYAINWVKEPLGESSTVQRFLLEK